MKHFPRADRYIEVVLIYLSTDACECLLGTSGIRIIVTIPISPADLSIFLVLHARCILFLLKFILNGHNYQCSPFLKTTCLSLLVAWKLDNMRNNNLKRLKNASNYITYLLCTLCLATCVIDLGSCRGDMLFNKRSPQFKTKNGEV